MVAPSAIGSRDVAAEAEGSDVIIKSLRFSDSDGAVVNVVNHPPPNSDQQFCSAPRGDDPVAKSLW